MRIAVCDDDEQEAAHLLELITEYQLSRRISLKCRSFHSGTDFLYNTKGGRVRSCLAGYPHGGGKRNTGC